LAGGAYSAPLAAFRGATSKDRGGKGNGRGGRGDEGKAKGERRGDGEFVF